MEQQFMPAEVFLTILIQALLPDLTLLPYPALFRDAMCSCAPGQPRSEEYGADGL